MVARAQARCRCRRPQPIHDALVRAGLARNRIHRAAYLLKEKVAGADELAQAIRTVAQSGSMIDPQIVDELIEAKSSRRKSDLSWLTPHESEILGEMAKGKSNAAIASSLQVSERAVEKHANSIFSKLGLTEERDLNRRVKAVLVYLSDPGGG